MAVPKLAKQKAKSTGDVVGDLWVLVKEYGKQETVDPLKALGRFAGYGTGAAICWGIAGTVLTLFVLRVLQVETRDLLDGNWSWVPYVVALVFSLGATYLSLKMVKRGTGHS